MTIEKYDIGFAYIRLFRYTRISCFSREFGREPYMSIMHDVESIFLSKILPGRRQISIHFDNGFVHNFG